ncbi:unnamed protein product, partial [Adineta ricciae]
MMEHMKPTKIVKMFYNNLSPAFVEIPIGHNKTKTVWVDNYATISYLRDRIREISGNYTDEAALTIGITTTTQSSSPPPPLNIIQNECISYPTANILF